MEKRSNIYLSFFLMCVIIFSKPMQAQMALESLVVGEVEESLEVLSKEEKCIPLVKVNGHYYIIDDDLKQLGLLIEEREDALYVKEQATLREGSCQMIEEYGQKAYSYPKLLYWDLMQSYVLVLNDHYYIPLSFLQGKWEMEKRESCWQIKKVKTNPYLYSLQGQGRTITHRGAYWLNLTLRHYYWQKDHFMHDDEKVLLGPGESYTWEVTENGIYAGTQYIDINGLTPSFEAQSDLNAQIDFYVSYSQAERLKALEACFPPSVIEAKMRYQVGKLKEKELVSLHRSEKHAYYWVKNDMGERIQVPFSSVQIIGERWVKLPHVTSEMIEEYVNLSDIESETDYLLWTDINRQRTYVLQKQEGKWHHIKTFICSSGKNNNPTPTGIYKVQYTLPYFGLDKGYRCKNALVFFRDYMYHSILFDKTGAYVKSGQYELGSKASHGCVRLSEKDSRWLYDHIPIHTTVWIR